MERREIYKASDEGTVSDRIVVRGPSMNSEKAHRDEGTHTKVGEQLSKENAIQKYAMQLKVFEETLPDDASMQISYPLARRTAN
jgi:hypothetical protein